MEFVRLAFALLVATALLASVGYAAGVGLTAPGAGAGDAAVTSCDTTGVTVSWGPTPPGFDPTIPGIEIKEVTINGIDEPECTGANLKLQLSDTGGEPFGPLLTIPDIGELQTGFTFNLSSQNLKVEDLEGVHVLLVGPP